MADIFERRAAQALRDRVQLHAGSAGRVPNYLFAQLQSILPKLSNMMNVRQCRAETAIFRITRSHRSRTREHCRLAEALAALVDDIPDAGVLDEEAVAVLGDAHAGIAPRDPVFTNVGE